MKNFNNYVIGDIYRCLKLERRGIAKVIESTIMESQVPLLEIDNHEYLILGEEYDVIKDIPEFENDVFINPASIKYIDKTKKINLKKGAR